MIEITLPFPPRTLHPNARPHWGTKSQATKAYRAHAFYAAKAAGTRKSKAAAAHVSITFHPPNHHKHDLDGLLSSLKSGLDGVSDALGIDDSKWSITIQKGEVIKGGKVTVQLQGISE